MLIPLLWIDLISNCKHLTLSPVKNNKHIVNLICRKCGLSCAMWESDLIDGPVADYTDADRELLKWMKNYLLCYTGAAHDWSNNL